MKIMNSLTAAVAATIATATVAYAQAPVTPARNPNDLTQSQDQLRSGQNDATNPTATAPGLPGATRDTDQRLTNPSANPAAAGTTGSGSQGPTPQAQAGDASPRSLPSQGSSPRGN